MLEFMILVIFGQNKKRAVRNAWHWCQLQLVGKCTVAAVVDPSVADPSLNQEINGASRVGHARNAVHVKSTLPLYQKGSKWNHETDLCFHQIHFKIYERMKTLDRKQILQIRQNPTTLRQNNNFHYCFECKHWPIQVFVNIVRRTDLKSYEIVGMFTTPFEHLRIFQL